MIARSAVKVAELMVKHALVIAVLRHQLIVSAPFDEIAVVEHQYQVGIFDR